MAVVDTTTVDQVAKGPDGRILLAMTEDRRYADGDAETLVEDFRQKLNAYVYLIRSGQLRDIAGDDTRNGVDIELFCFDQPPVTVTDMITLANQGLTGDNVHVGYTVHTPPTADDVLKIIRRTLIERAPANWNRIELSASLVGNGIAGGLSAITDNGEKVLLEPDQTLIDALKDLKKLTWTPENGTWLTFQAVVTPDRLHPYYDNDGEPPGGTAGFKPEDWADELDRYPRATVPDWWPHT